MDREDLIKNGMLVNILVTKEDGLIVAHCLELDIVATGDTIDQVQRDIIALICAQIDYAFSNDNLDHLYHPAPKEVWREFYACSGQMQKKHNVYATFSENSASGSFVPPWIIANTCQSPNFCNV